MSDKEKFLSWLNQKAAELREWPAQLTVIDSSGDRHVIDSGRDELLEQLKFIKAFVSK
jgi:hypothetical protein